MTLTYRAAVAADADALADVVAEGFESYAAFAPEGWTPPDRLEMAMGLVMRIPDPDWWCRVAEDDGHLVAQIAIMPAAKHRRSSDEPGLAHLLQLFVRRAYWGSEIARTLHAESVAEAAARGYTSMRLFTPSAHGRARRFYEREGWSAVGDPHVEADLGGLEIIEYRRKLGRGQTPSPVLGRRR
jgi:GNAT superfamily N-acetyltransferase